MSYADVTAPVSSEQERSVLQTSAFSCWRQLFPAWHGLAEPVFPGCVPQQRAQHGRATRATTTSFCHPALLGSLVLPAAFGEPVGPTQDSEPFPAPAGQVWTHCRSCCNPTSHQAEFEARFPSLLPDKEWESWGMSVLKADTFLSRLKDKIPFLMSGISPGLCSLLPAREWLEQPKRTEGHWTHRASPCQPECPVPAWCSPMVLGSGAG